MTIRKTPIPSKPGSPKITAKAQRAKSAIVRSPKPKGLRSVPADPIKSSMGHNEPKQDAATIEDPATALHEALKQQPELNKAFDVSTATTTARAYQTKMLEMAQANMQFALECPQRLAAVRSPVQLLHVIGELTTQRIAMFRRYSSEMIDLSNEAMNSSTSSSLDRF